MFCLSTCRLSVSLLTFVCLSASQSVGRSENSHLLVNDTFLTHLQLQPRPEHTSVPQHSFDDSTVRSACGNLHCYCKLSTAFDDSDESHILEVSLTRSRGRMHSGVGRQPAYLISP